MRCFDYIETEAGHMKYILFSCQVTPAGKALFYMHPRKSPEVSLSLSAALQVITA